MAEGEENAPEIIEGEEELFGEFNSIGVLIEQICKTDMKVIATTSERIWKHEGAKDYTTGWKPDTTQLSSGALFQISDVIKIAGVSGKGWNESSEYIMGKIDSKKWIRLINFRGYATAVPDTETFKKRTTKLVEKIQQMQKQTTREKGKREMAEQRLSEAEKRVSDTEQLRNSAENRVKEFEENFRKMEKLGEEKEEVAAKSVSIAKREAHEAKVLMRYFEDRMADSEKNYITCSENLLKAEETTRIKEAEMKESETRVQELEKQLEQSERARIKLESNANRVVEADTKSERPRESTIKKKSNKKKGKTTNPVE